MDRSELRLKRVRSSLETRLQDFLAAKDEALDTYEKEVARLSSLNKSLLKKISEMEDADAQRSKSMKELERKLQTVSQNVTNKAYNMMNIKLNEYKQRVDELQAENASLRKSHRTPLKVIKQEPNAPSVIALLQRSGESAQEQSSKQENVDPLSAIDPGNMDMKSSSNSYDDGEFDSNENIEFEFPSQFSINNNFQSNKEGTFDIRKYKHPVNESYDMKAGNIDLPTSSPVQSDYHGSSDVVSPVKVKKEGAPLELVEIEDSFCSSDEEDIIKNSRDALPTPLTTSKPFKTPLVKNYKRPLLIQTPDDATPSKKSKTYQHNTKSTGPTKQSVLDLSTNFKANRCWIPEDFKINPAKNDNIQYAYQITLRDKSARSCIHGKTCASCEKFYKSLEAIPNYEISGPQWNDKSWKESSKNFKIVTKTSRHKQLWERPESAPGFGDFDFPTTQQLAQNRLEAEFNSKRKAYERLYSAIHDQRFIFKDEDYNKAVRDRCFKVDEEIFYKYLEKADE